MRFLADIQKAVDRPDFREMEPVPLLVTLDSRTGHQVVRDLFLFHLIFIKI